MALKSPMAILLLFLIPMGLLLLSDLLSLKSQPAYGKKEPFECGFANLSASRVAFSVRFYLLVVLFLIMDVEITFLLPLISMLHKCAWPMMGTLWGFLAMLMFGVMYEIWEGSFKWGQAN